MCCLWTPPYHPLTVGCRWSLSQNGGPWDWTSWNPLAYAISPNRRLPTCEIPVLCCFYVCVNLPRPQSDDARPHHHPDCLSSTQDFHFRLGTGNGTEFDNNKRTTFQNDKVGYIVVNWTNIAEDTNRRDGRFGCNIDLRLLSRNSKRTLFSLPALLSHHRKPLVNSAKEVCFVCPSVCVQDNSKSTDLHDIFIRRQY